MVSILSTELLRVGYSQLDQGTFITRDRRRVVVLMVADRDPAKWDGQVNSALQAAGMQQAPAWARYVVLVQAVPSDEQSRVRAAAFARDVTKCRRLVVFPPPNGEPPTLPFLPLASSQSAQMLAPDTDVRRIVEKHLAPDVAQVFADADAAHAAVERDVDERVSKDA